jgi:hypothetical protein
VVVLGCGDDISGYDRHCSSEEEIGAWFAESTGLHAILWVGRRSRREKLCRTRDCRSRLWQM